MNKRGVLLKAAAMVFIGVGLGLIAATCFPFLIANIETDKLQEDFVSESSQQEYPDIDWNELKAANPDVIAWVHVPDTNISYPVVAASQDKPQFYLKHNLYGNYNFAGVPYLDSKCKRDFTSYNSVIFGHHLINDTMFSPFANYSDQTYFDQHRTIYLLTPDRTYKLKAVAANVVNGNSEQKQVLYSSQAHYLSYWQEQLSESEVVADDAPLAPLRNFCFCTCSYQTSNSRTLVYAVVDGEVIKEHAGSDQQESL